MVSEMDVDDLLNTTDESGIEIVAQVKTPQKVANKKVEIKLEENPQALYEEKIRNKVRLRYHKAKKEFRHFCEENRKPAFDKARSCRRVYRRGPFSPQALPRFTKKLVMKGGFKTVEMEAYDTVCPPMVFYTKSWKNVPTPDSLTLSHIPYLPNNEDQMEVFESELNAIYPYGIHGTAFDYERYINDKIVYDTIKLVKAQKCNTISNEELFKAMYDLFPNKFPLGKLAKVFPRLEERFGPKSACPNVLDKSVAQIIKTIRPMKCKKCDIFYCIKHPPQFDKLSLSIPSENYQPEKCDGGCDMAMLARLETQKINADPMGYLKCIVVWTEKQKSLVNVMPLVHMTNTCVITKLLHKEYPIPFKSCDDVYEYLTKKYRTQGKPQVTEQDRHRYVRRFRALKSSETLQNRYPYIPCDHEGSCLEAQCVCFNTNNICTKYCRCFQTDCPIQFPGCRCSPGKCHTVACDCYRASWECDSDLCKNCCDGEVDGRPVMNCKNTVLQNNVQKNYFIAPSKVEGWGGYAGQDFERNEFICEYVGEVISLAECNRRGKIYDKFKKSYMFTLNEHFVADAALKGNEARFINHSDKPNCQARVFVVNTEHRIGIFAKEPIKMGTELFFQYGYEEQHKMQFVPKELNRKKQVMIRQEDGQFKVVKKIKEQKKMPQNKTKKRGSVN